MNRVCIIPLLLNLQCVLPENIQIPTMEGISIIIVTPPHPSDHNLFCVMLRLTKQQNPSTSMTIRSFKNYSSERFNNLITFSRNTQSGKHIKRYQQINIWFSWLASYFCLCTKFPSFFRKWATKLIIFSWISHIF